MKFFKITRYTLFIIFIILACVLYFSFNYLYNNTTTCSIDNLCKKLPVIMYHHISEKDKLLGKFTITPSQFEKDLIYLRENGYETISMEQLLAYVYDNAPLPEKPIMITFDDGHESFYEYIYPLLQEYNSKAILSIVGSFTETFSQNEDHNVDYSYITWKQVNELSDSPYVEIANHSYDLHKIENGRKGCSKNSNESIDEYRIFLEEDILKLQTDILNYTGVKSTSFVYPFGKFSKESKDILKDFGFSSLFTCAEVINIIDKDNPDFLYNLGRFNRPHGINSSDFFDKVFKDI